MIFFGRLALLNMVLPRHFPELLEAGKPQDQVFLLDVSVLLLERGTGFDHPFPRTPLFTDNALSSSDIFSLNQQRMEVKPSLCSCLSLHSRNTSPPPQDTRTGDLRMDHQ